VSLGINRPLQPQDELTIEYGGPYWQIFWPHLSLEQQRRIKSHYTDIVFPPSHWPQVIPRGYHDQNVSDQLESDYSLAARNIYDVLRQTDKVEDVDGDGDIWAPEEPSSPPIQQRPSPAVLQQPTQKARTPHMRMATPNVPHPQ
jgi:hypothetical protein